MTTKPADNRLLEQLLSLYSFDFNGILSHATVQHIYLNYLTATKRQETLLFYQGVTLFKTMKSDSCRYHMAMYLIQVFIYDNSPMQINIPHEIKTSLLYQKISEDCTPVTYFDSSQRLVSIQLKEETFRDFVNNCMELKRYLVRELRSRPLRPLPESIKNVFEPKQFNAMDYLPIADLHSTENSIKRSDFISLQHLCDDFASADMWKRAYRSKDKYTIYLSKAPFDRNGFLTMKIDMTIPYDMDCVLSCLLNRNNRLVFDKYLTSIKTMGFTMSPDGIRSLITSEKYKVNMWCEERSSMVYHSIRYNKHERTVYIPYRSFKPAEEELKDPKVRAQVIGGYILSELKPGVTRVVHLDYMNLYGWIPSSLYNSRLTSRGSHLYNNLMLLLDYECYGVISNFRTTPLLKQMCR